MADYKKKGGFYLANDDHAIACFKSQMLQLQRILFHLFQGGSLSSN